MCGIAGIASTRGPVAERRWLPVARDAMRHRGPDDAGEWWSSDGRVGLAHRRLSIIDLSAAGHQPMEDADAALCVSFNGEIYNYRDVREQLVSMGHAFRTNTDTEVLLAAYKQWGVKSVEKLNGMFAFALFDARRGILVLSRDRAGEKPLYYSSIGGQLRFGSELKALMVDPNFPRRVDHESLDCYLAFGYVPGERCILQGVQKLPPAHVLTLHLETGQLRVERYWHPPEFNPDGGATGNEGDLVDELEVLLENAVRRQMVADVPVGVLLSGGVDSSLVAAMAARAVPRVRTFTVRFAGHERFDETEHARLIARAFGTEHTELEAAHTSADVLLRLARQFDEPIIDSSMIPTFLVSELIRKHCTVAIGGDGGDELFGGYSHYNRMLWMQRAIGWMPATLRRTVATLAGRNLRAGTKGRNWLQSAGCDMKHHVPFVASHFDRQSREKLLAGCKDWSFSAERIRLSRMAQSTNLLQRATRTDFQNYMVDDILVKVDRASMLCSLEARSPILDRHVIEFAFSKVPASLKATSEDRKILLKRLTRKILPPQFDRQRKQGFSVPLGDWLRQSAWSDFFRGILLGSPGSVFCKSAVAALLQDHANGKSNSERLFGLVFLELWRQEYGISF